MYKLDLGKARGTRNRIANIPWIREKAGEIQKNIYFIDYTKAFDSGLQLWKIFKEMGLPYNLTCLLRNLYAGQEATIITNMEQQTGFNIGKGLCQGCILSVRLYIAYLCQYRVHHAKCWAG